MTGIRRWIGMMIAAALLCAAFAPDAAGTAARAEAPSAEYLIDMTPEEVRQLEDRLSALGFLSSAPDAVYDAETRLAVQAFQQANGIEASGEPDALTRERVYADDSVSRQEYLRRFADAYSQMEPLENGNINNQVQVLQRKLNEYGYFSGSSDGVFGDATQTAVERFQMVNGLEVTGIADGATIMRLMAGVPITWQGFLSEMSAAAGDVGLNVYALQKKLGEMGYYKGETTGSFSDLTQRAVEDFQEQNGMEVTGIADAAVWELIYSGSAVSLRRADVIGADDEGEPVAEIQRQLIALGYLSGAADGVFGWTTQTAARLFQMANGLPSTGELDAAALDVLMGGGALPIADERVQQTYANLLEGRSDTVQAVIAEIAGQMLGAAFDVPDDALYPGFALAQYVCVAAGLPITQPETLIRLAEDPVESASEVDAGNIVAIKSTDGDRVTMLLTVGAGDGRIIYATEQVGWVVMSYIDQMNGASMFRWAERAETAP